jgi:hypothetical protein
MKRIVTNGITNLESLFASNDRYWKYGMHRLKAQKLKNISCLPFSRYRVLIWLKLFFPSHFHLGS